MVEKRILNYKSKKMNTEKVQCSCGFISGGDKRDRTADLLNAIQALSHLSYTPKYLFHCITKKYFFQAYVFSQQKIAGF